MIRKHLFVQSLFLPVSCLMLSLCGCGDSGGGDDSEPVDEKLDPCTLEAAKSILAEYDFCKDAEKDDDIAWIKDGDTSQTVPDESTAFITVRQCFVVCGNNTLPDNFESMRITRDTTVIGIERNGEKPGFQFANLTKPLFEIENGSALTFRNIDLKGDATFGELRGIIANYMGKGTIENIRYEGNIKSNLSASMVWSLGGILFASIANATISHCTISGKSSIEIEAPLASSEFGGLVGMAIETVIRDNIIDVSSDVFLKYTSPRKISEIGGFVGRMSGGEFTNNQFNGNIEVSLEADKKNGEDHVIGSVGGLIGVVEKTNVHDNTLTSSLKVAGGYDTKSIGGVIGQMKAGRLVNNELIGSMDVSGDKRTMYIGGLIGFAGDGTNDKNVVESLDGNHISLSHLNVEAPDGSNHAIGGMIGKLAHLYFTITNSSLNLQEFNIKAANEKNASLTYDGVGAIIGNGTHNPTVSSGRSIVLLENIQTVISKVSLFIGGEDKIDQFGSLFGAGRIKDSSHHVFTYINNAGIDYACETPKSDNVFRYVPNSSDAQKYYTALCNAQPLGDEAVLYSANDVYCRLNQDGAGNWSLYNLGGLVLALLHPSEQLPVAAQNAPECAE